MVALERQNAHVTQGLVRRVRHDARIRYVAQCVAVGRLDAKPEGSGSIVAGCEGEGAQAGGLDRALPRGERQDGAIACDLLQHGARVDAGLVYVNRWCAA